MTHTTHSQGASRPNPPSARFSSWLQAVALLAASLALSALVGCTSLPENVERTASYAYTDTDGTTFGQARREEIRRHPGESGFLLLGNGLDAFVARAVLAGAGHAALTPNTTCCTMISRASCSSTS